MTANLSNPKIAKDSVRFFVQLGQEAGDDWRVDGVTRQAGLPLAQIPPQLSQAVKGARYTPMVYAVPNCGTIVILTGKITRSTNNEL